MKGSPTHVIVPAFAKEAKALREHFEARFSPDAPPNGRFVWDYWHVPGQYTYLRTPAYHFFPKKIYEAFHNRLALWGREQLGCHDISPPWLSYYIDGCEQNLHADVPHGPWAFVYSLSPKDFPGGETLMLQEEALRYWENLPKTLGQGLEAGELVRKIPPRFNQLLVFDPRVPHGVARVEGVRDPRKARLVIHGWFVEPRPFIAGPLRVTAVEAQIARLTEHLEASEWLQNPLHGSLILRYRVDRAGRVAQAKIVWNGVRALGGDPDSARGLANFALKEIGKMRLGPQKGGSTVTLPLNFR